MCTENTKVMKYHVALLLLVGLFQQSSALESVWRYECREGFCQKIQITPETEATALSLAACRLFCSPEACLWPKPTGAVAIAPTLVKINPNSVDVFGAQSETATFDLINGAKKIFHTKIQKLTPNSQAKTTPGRSLIVTLVLANKTDKSLGLQTDESYTLHINETSDGRVNATISAANFFGGRHGLETLSQLIIFDDLRNEIQMPPSGRIEDRPAYPYRGILLDTARNFVDVATIKRTLDGMAASKLNAFHWHITDSQSFPWVSASVPELSKYGAYSPRKVYTASVVDDIIRYGLERGVRVIPEFDAPAHVGEGWQNTGLVTCFNKKPWLDFCVEPPCGQLDPTQDKLYDLLELIYGDMLSQFQPDIFHMGGDEVHFGCWNSTDSIVSWMKNKGWGRTEADFVKLWEYFQNKALHKVYEKAGREIPVVMWTSTLTQAEYVAALPKEKYIVQIWTTGADQQVGYLLEKGYRLILSNYDALYFDCGFSGWVTDGNNWCSPYSGWQKVYENSPLKIAGERKGQVLGAEATLWTEQADSTSIDSRLWPRASAMGEVLWSEPKTGWRDAEQRMLVQRERLVEAGIGADALEPEWCQQNEENCPTTGKFNAKAV